MFTRTIPPAPQPLVGTNWTLESFHTADAVSSVISGTTINAVFGEDGKVSGSDRVQPLLRNLYGISAIAFNRRGRVNETVLQ